MGTLYIDRQGLSLHLQGGVIGLRADGERLRTVPAGDARARIAQCQRVADEPWATAWSRQIVRAKLCAQRRLLQGALKARADLRKPLTDAVTTLQRVQDRLPQATDRASLRGLEGAGAAAYFSPARQAWRWPDAPGAGGTSGASRLAPTTFNRA